MTRSTSSTGTPRPPPRMRARGVVFLAMSDARRSGGPRRWADSGRATAVNWTDQRRQRTLRPCLGLLDARPPMGRGSRSCGRGDDRVSVCSMRRTAVGRGRRAAAALWTTRWLVVGGKRGSPRAWLKSAFGDPSRSWSVGAHTRRPLSSLFKLACRLLDRRRRPGSPPPSGKPRSAGFPAQKTAISVKKPITSRREGPITE
jgi:hypothetical protein